MDMAGYMNAAYVMLEFLVIFGNAALAATWLHTAELFPTEVGGPS
jgi:hypothetical protein